MNQIALLLLCYCFFTIVCASRSRSRFDHKVDAFRWDLQHLYSEYGSKGPMILMVDRNNFAQSTITALVKMKPRMLRGSPIKIQYNNEQGRDTGGLTRDFFTQASRIFFDPSSPLGLFQHFDGFGGGIHVRPTNLPLTSTKKKEYLVAGMILGLALLHRQWFGVGLSRILFHTILHDEKDSISLEMLQDQIDPIVYQALLNIHDQPIDPSLDLTFEYNKDPLIANGPSVDVTEENKTKYLGLVLDWHTYRERSQQLKMFRQGFFQIVPRRIVLLHFSPSDLSTFLSGNPEISVKDWMAHAVVLNATLAPNIEKYFWRFVESLNQEERSKLLQFVTGSSRLPAGGFSDLKDMDGHPQPFSLQINTWSKASRLPTACTCLKRLYIPQGYPTYQVLSEKLRLAMEHVDQGFQHL